MTPSFRQLAAPMLLALAGATACSTARAPQPGETPRPQAATTPAPAAAPARDTARRGYTAADVRFMQQMIHHHAQALTMSALAPSRSRREDVRLLAERIAVSQRDEIALMRQWLARHGEAVPAVGAGHGAHAAMGHDAAQHAAHMASMPGMLSDQEMSQLSAAAGPAFDRLFLTLMIKHHEGALIMVAALQAAPGAGQDTEVFRLVSDIDAGQRAEIRRMRSMLGVAAPAAGRP